MAAEGLDPVPAPGGGQQQATAAPSNAVLAAATRVKGAATALLAQAKPWSELADRSAFSKPGDLAEVGGDWGSLQRQENAKMRHRFFFFARGAPTFFSLSFFFEKKKESSIAFRAATPACAPEMASAAVWKASARGSSPASCSNMLESVDRRRS